MSIFNLNDLSAMGVVMGCQLQIDSKDKIERKRI